MNKKPFTKKKIINFFKSQKKIIKNTEIVKLLDAKERILAENLKSKINIPPFNNSAVDGYTILKSDLLLGKKLICNRRITAGDKKNLKNKKGEVIRIFTGAKMPLNSSTVVMQENTVKKNGKVILLKIPNLGENYRLKGEDIRKNQIILKKGDIINNQNLNLVAAAGITKIKVYKKIKIGFFTSGNELRNSTTKLKGSEINNSNFYSLSLLLDKKYISKKYCGNLKDSFSFVEKQIKKNSKKFNVLITAGGASVGEEDYLISVLLKIGKIFFWKAAIKPGRPIAVGKIKNTFIICLPGNPVSVQLLYSMIIDPFVKYLAGEKFSLPKSEKIIANFSMNKKTNRMEWLRVIKKRIKNVDYANKYNKQGSGMISSIAYSDGIIEVPENVQSIKKGELYNFYSFQVLF